MVAGTKGRVRRARPRGRRSLPCSERPLAAAGPANASATTASADDRYSLVHGCFGAAVRLARRRLRRQDGRRLLRHGRRSLAGAEPFRMQATDLGKYLLYGAAEDFLALDATPVVGGIVSADAPSDGRTGPWTRRARPSRSSTRRSQAARGRRGRRRWSRSRAAAGQAGRLHLRGARAAVPTYPEVDVNATGDPATGSPALRRGLGPARRPHAPYGLRVPRRATPIAASPGTGSARRSRSRTAPTTSRQRLRGGPRERRSTASRPAATTPVGWPTFNDWPDPNSLTHEQSYYRWLERASCGGLRIFVNLLVENSVLCEVYPTQAATRCDEMDTVLLAGAADAASSRTTSTPRAAAPARAGSGSSQTRSRRAR